MGVELTVLFIAVLITLIVCLVKLLLCNCLYTRREDDDSLPILPSRSEAFWIEYDRLRNQAMNTRQPPPDFDDAIRNSRPVSYIEMEEDPPPTYDDFLKSHTPSPIEPSPLAEPVGRRGENSLRENFPSLSTISPFDDDFVPPVPTREEFSEDIVHDLRNLGAQSEA